MATFLVNNYYDIECSPLCFVVEKYLAHSYIVNLTAVGRRDDFLFLHNVGVPSCTQVVFLRTNTLESLV